MKRFLAFILIIISAILLTFTVSCKSSSENVIAVAIVPLQTFAKQIVKDKFEVVVAVPNGQSPESYEPKPKDIMALTNAKVYFSIGIPNEYTSILPNVKGKKVMLNNLLTQSGYQDRYFENGGRDPHVWLSIKRAIKCVEFMLDEICLLDSENASFYTQNANEYIAKLNEAYTEIATIFNNVSSDKKVFIAYHPSYGYFADEFGLTMYAIENEGHEATIKDLVALTLLAKEKGIKKVFYQAETDKSQALAFANEIDGEAVVLSPLAGDYINNLKEMANKILQSVE